MDIREKLNFAISLINEEKFVKAHDFFEKLWREYKDEKTTRNESFILKAFVNGCVNFELYKMNRIEHSVNVWNTYKKYEHLIDEIDSINKDKYLQIKDLIYKKREKLIK